MFIYLITNMVTGKYYVGQTIQRLRDRFYGHVHASKGMRRKDRSIRLHSAFKKYGIESFNVELLATASSTDSLANLEKLWMIALNALDRDTGYNISFGSGPPPFSEESRRKMSDRAKLRWANGVATANSLESLKKGRTPEKIAHARKTLEAIPREERAQMLRRASNSRWHPNPRIEYGGELTSD